MPLGFRLGHTHADSGLNTDLKYEATEDQSPNSPASLLHPQRKSDQTGQKSTRPNVELTRHNTISFSVVRWHLTHLTELTIHTKLQLTRSRSPQTTLKCLASAWTAVDQASNGGSEDRRCGRQLQDCQTAPVHAAWMAPAAP